MENRELSIADVENALMFVSCDTTELDNPEEVYERNFPFTFRDGRLLCFEVSPDDVDADFDMSEYDEEFRGRYNLEKYSSLQAFANAVLNREGKEYVEAFYYDEELVVDNRFTFTLFNDKREVVFTYSKIVDAEVPKPIIQDEKEEEDEQESSSTAIPRWMEKTLEIHDDKFRSDRRVVLFHLFVLFTVAALVWWLGHSAGWTPKGKRLVSITSGLYFTQWLWCNLPREHLGVFENATRRAAGRQWINGGFILGILLTLINVVYYIYNPPMESFAHFYMMWWVMTLCITFVWAVLVICFREQNKTQLDELIDLVCGGMRRNLRWVGFKQFIRSFFLDMLPIDWELKIRNKHIEYLDRKEREIK